MTRIRTHWRRVVVAVIGVAGVAMLAMAPPAEADHDEVDQSACATFGAAGYYVVICPDRYGL